MREFLQGDGARHQQEGEHGHAISLLAGLGVELFPIGVQRGDVGLVGMGDMRDIEPCAMQMRARQPLQPGKRHGLDGTELGEILGWDFGNATCGCRRRAGAGQGALHIILGDPPFRAGPSDHFQIDIEFACQTPD